MRREHRDELLRGFLAINALLREELSQARKVIAARRADAEAEAKYNPNWRLQPRAPKGTAEGGQWVEGGGSRERRPTRSAPKHERTSPRRGLDLREHEKSPTRRNGGHTIRDHVARSRSALVQRVRNARVTRIGAGRFRIVVRTPSYAGSFASISDANRLVSIALQDHDIVVNQVATGQLRGNRYLFVRLGNVTGYEAYFDQRTNSVRTRDTFGVSVVIRHDPTSPTGYTVRTAFPSNINPAIPMIAVRPG